MFIEVKGSGAGMPPKSLLKLKNSQLRQRGIIFAKKRRKEKMRRFPGGT